MNNTTETKSSIPAKIDNHVLLNTAINDMDSVIAHAENVLARIKGDDMNEAGTDNIASTPSLVEVLQRGSQTIQDKNSKLHDILNEIVEHLY